MQNNGNKGFTLVELIVVIAIIAILAAVSIVGYNQFIDQARDSRASTELDVIVRQVESAYYVDGATLYFDASANDNAGEWSTTVITNVVTGDLKLVFTFDPAESEFTFTLSEGAANGSWDTGVIGDYNDHVAAGVLAAVNNALTEDDELLATDLVITPTYFNPGTGVDYYALAITYSVDGGDATWDGVTVLTPIET